MTDANRPGRWIDGFRKIAIAICIVMVVFMIVLAPAFRSARETAQSVVCKKNLKILSGALTMYSQDWDGHYPPAGRWMDCIDNNKYLGQDRTTLFHCPAAVSQYGYATNAQLSGKSVQITESNDVVLLFETDSPKRNANGTKTSLARPRHHMLNCAFCDGSVAWVNLYTQNRWKWTVPKP